MAMWDDATPFFPSDYLRPLRARAPRTCERCGREIPESRSYNRNWLPKRFCSELCRKRAERARWKARWKKRGVNKYIGAKG